jgi:hypothetical protein
MVIVVRLSSIAFGLVLVLAGFAVVVLVVVLWAFLVVGELLLLLFWGLLLRLFAGRNAFQLDYGVEDFAAFERDQLGGESWVLGDAWVMDEDLPKATHFSAIKIPFSTEVPAHLIWTSVYRSSWLSIKSVVLGMDDSLLTRIEFGGSWFFEVIALCG